MLASGTAAHAQSGLGITGAADAHAWDFGLTLTHSPAPRYMAEWRLLGGMLVNDPYNGEANSYSGLLPLGQMVSAVAWSMFTPRPDRFRDTVATANDGGSRSRWIYAALFGPLWAANSRHHLTLAGPGTSRLSAFGGARTHLYAGPGDDGVWWVRTGPELGLRAYKGAREPDFLASNAIQGMSLELGARYDVDIVHSGRSAWRGFVGLTVY